MLFLGAALLALSDPAVAAAPAQPAQPVAAKPVKERKICKVDENESTSRLRKRVCLTATEWDQRSQGVNTNDLKNMGAR